MNRLEILVGSGAFWRRAAEDIAAAQERLLVQAMTFEADGAGNRVAAAILGSGAADRRVLVDDYSRHVINDRVVASPAYLTDRSFRSEVLATRAMFDAIAASGAGLRITNPIGRNPLRYVVRNHKKLIVVDGVAYIGGINFSDHNFAWHDMMLRIEGAEAAAFLARDFGATWDGTPVSSRARFGALGLYALDGKTNRDGFADVFAAISGARSRIELISAYPTFPFVDALGEAGRRGVDVRLFTPLPNNKPVVRDYLIGAAARAGITVCLLPKMTHLKAILIDGTRLVMGSSNFDFASLHVEEEYLAFVEDTDLIAAFEEAVLEPARAAALPAGAHRVPRWRSALSKSALRAAEAAVKLGKNAPRGAADWPVQRPGGAAKASGERSRSSER